MLVSELNGALGKGIVAHICSKDGRICCRMRFHRMRRQSQAERLMEPNKNLKNIGRHTRSMAPPNKDKRLSGMRVRCFSELRFWPMADVFNESGGGSSLRK